MSGLLKAAASGSLVDVNVAWGETLEISTGASPGRELVRLEADQVRLILDAARGTTWEVPFNLVARLGLRRSEALGLSGTTSTSTGARSRSSEASTGLSTMQGPGWSSSRLKTAASARTIVAGRQLLALPHRLQQAERREMVGDAWLDSGVVCDNDVGGPLDPDSMSTAFKRKLARLGLPQQYVAPTAQQTAGAVAALDSILGE